MSSQGGKSDSYRVFPIKCKGVPTKTYQEKNLLKSDARKPDDKLTKSDLSQTENKSQVVNSDACNNNVGGKCTTNSDCHRKQKLLSSNVS